MFYVYVLYSRVADKFYIGYSADLKRRVMEHKSCTSLSDRTIKNLKLVYYEACLSKEDAQLREKQLKTGFGRQYLRKRLQSSISPP
ncbi:GIY-YIG nuclease family protein [Candidatus Kaiserbacteria bacterium]|nr:GIY-YIG nuclease family protein [Candidatus Kaiserbacteria bacterium]